MPVLLQDIRTFRVGCLLTYTQPMMDDFIKVLHSSSINLMCNTDTDMTLGGYLQGGGPVVIILVMTV